MVWVLNVEVWVRHAEQKFLTDQCPTSRRAGGCEAGLQLHLAVLSRGMNEICPASKIPRCSAERAAHGPASETLSFARPATQQASFNPRASAEFECMAASGVTVVLSGCEFSSFFNLKISRMT